MVMIAKAAVALYIWLIAPFLLGNLWMESGKKITDRFVFTFLMGMVSEWAVFFVLAKYAIARELALHELGNMWFLTLVVLSLVALAYGIKKKHFAVRKPETSMTEIVLEAVLLLLLIALGMLCGGMAQEEYTVENVLTMNATDTLYQIDATTGLGKDEMFSMQKEAIANASKAPIDAYYATTGFLCRLNPVKYVRILLPFFLSLFYYGVYHIWAKTLFPANRGKRIGFQCVVWLLYATAIVSDKAVLFQVFFNCWNGETLFFVGLLPLAVWLLLHETNKRRWVMRYVLCALAGQLLYGKGGFVVSFLWGIAILTEGIKRWKNDSSI